MGKEDQKIIKDSKKISCVEPAEEKTEIEIREDLTHVVDRIKKIIPENILLELFSSTKNETGGKIIFPYCRVDSAVIVASNCAELLTRFEKTSDDFDKWYEMGSRSAFRALVWIEIGFQGLQNLAINRASINWTSAVGHFVNDEQRAEKIMTDGKKMLDEKIKDFVKLRNKYGIKNDIFSKYGVEYLLDPYQ